MSSISGRSEINLEPSGDKASTGRLGDRIFSGLATGSGAVVVILILLVAAFLISQAIPAGDATGGSFTNIVTAVGTDDEGSTASSTLTTEIAWSILSENLGRFQRGEPLTNLVDKHRGW